MVIMGITGGLGCGKSTVAGLVERRGYRRIDSDALVRERVLTSPEVVAALGARYGAAVVDPGGQVHRGALAERVFADDAERRWLEDLTHPVVFSLWRAAFAAEPAARWVVEVPLLFEKGLANWFDFTICVATSSALQLSRLQARGVSPDLAAARIAKQLPLPRKIAAADFVLLNDGSLDFLREQVALLAGRWL